MRNGKRILLAEDDPLDAELTLTALAEHGLADEVVVAEDGAEALDYLFRRGKFADREGPDPVLLLLDLKMPRVNGLEVLKEVRASEALRRLPIIMLTSSSEEQDVVTSYDEGVNAFVVKPVDYQKFVAAVKTVGKFWTMFNNPPPPADGPRWTGGGGGRS